VKGGKSMREGARHERGRSMRRGAGACKRGQEHERGGKAGA